MDPSLFAAVCHYRDIAYRNIVRVPRERNLFARVSDDPEDEDVALGAERAALGWHSQSPINQPFNLGYGVIGYPFVRKHWAQNRYSDGSFGVWYGSESIETTVYETAHHFRQELIGRNWIHGDRPIIRERRVVTADVDALVFDLRTAAKSQPLLVADTDYTLTRKIGHYIKANRHPGLLAPSARREPGYNVDVFFPEYLSNPRDVCNLSYRYMPDGRLQIRRGAGEVWFTL